MAPGLGPIDWAPPWFDGWREWGEPVAQRGWPLHQALNAATDGLAGATGSAMRFVPQHDLPAGQAYEAHVFDAACCPTRDNLHDFFNGLCWLRFPLTKRRLNELQAQQIAEQGIRPVRGPVRDALTLLDENGAFLQAPEPLWAALRAREWTKLFVEMRPLWAQARLTVFGHALLEKLVQPRKDLTAHVYIAQDAMKSIAIEGADGLDGRWAQDMDAGHLATKPFTPLPLLGVPGWWPPNQNFSFYDDSQIFRPRRPK